HTRFSRDWSSDVCSSDIHVRFQFGKIDLNDLVKISLRIGIHFRVGCQVFGNGVGHGGNIGAVGGTQVIRHAGVVPKNGRGCAHLGTHITDGTFSGGGKRSGTFPEIFDNGTGSPLYSQDTRHFQNDVFRGSPAVHTPGEFDPD